MPEYIKREVALKELCYYPEAQEYIRNITAADVAPVVHGRWNADETCPFCGNKSTEGLDAEKWDYWFPDFCPSCGVRMDGASHAPD